MRKRLSVSTKVSKDKKLYDCFKEFILYKRVHNISDNTITSYEMCYHKINLFLNQEQIKACEINQELINNYILWLKGGGIKAITINTQLNGLRVFIKYCQKLGYVEESVVVPKVRQEETIKDTYTDNELSILIKKPNLKTASFTDYRDWVIVNVLLGTGIRSRTLCNLKMDDVDLLGSNLYCRTMKNRIPQIIPISKSLQKVLSKWIELRKVQSEGKDDWLFPSLYGEKLNKDSLGHSLKKYNNRRGVIKSGVHIWRHTFAKKWILGGGDIFRLQKLLGHREMDMVRKYVNMFGDDIEKDFDKFNPLEQINLTSNRSKLKIK